MTFLKPDRRGISVLYVSLSGTFVVILGAVSRCPFYFLWCPEASEPPQKDDAPIRASNPFPKEKLFQLKSKSFLIKLAIPKNY